MTERSGVLVTPCEIASRRYVPAIRASVAIALIKVYGLTAYRAAKLLGLTPAAVSNYLLRRRGGELVDIILSTPELQEMAHKIAAKLAEGESDPRELGGYVCDMCKRLREIVERRRPECPSA